VRRVPIRMKLAAALIAPLAALVLVTVVEVVQSTNAARDARAQTALATASLGPGSVLSSLEDERNAGGVYLVGQEENFALGITDNAEARAQTDAAIAGFRSALADSSSQVQNAYQPALDALSRLAPIRQQIDDFTGVRELANIDITAEVFDEYTDVMGALHIANKQVLLAIDDADLRRGAELFDLSSRQTNIIAVLVRHLLLAQVGGEAPDGVNDPHEIGAVARLLGQLRTNEDLIRTKGTGEYRGLVDDLFAAEETQRFPEVVQSALDTGTVDLDSVMTYSAGEDADTFGYRVFRQAVTANLESAAADIEARAATWQLNLTVLAGAVVVAATTIAVVVARSITRPLRSLTRQAKEMAGHRLPEAVLDILDTPLGEDVDVPEVEPVIVRTRDEVADVAAALNTVQDTALDLAVEQAVLRRNIADSFVNLGRRNQNLLGRQLDFITELETNETNPDSLANLFRLDHLATRMRRNAESLLVLAGIEPPRKWAAPVRLTDVIRAALGEVEDYQRVTVRGVEPATIIGSAAADLAHLLAELIENALVFSPPDQTVDIRGRNRPAPAATGTRDMAGYTLAIIDSGLGMPPDDIAAANRRLAGAESFTIAPSKYLGHYVAGNLAARHDIHVHLDNSPGNGITATIEIPPTLLTTETVTSAPVTPPHGGRAIGAPPPQVIQTNGAARPQAQPARPAATDATVPHSRRAPAAATAVPGAPDGRSAPADRTSSGLTKRAGRAATSPPANGGPSADLLAALSRHTDNLQQGGGGQQAGGGRRSWDAPSTPSAATWQPPPSPPQQAQRPAGPAFEPPPATQPPFDTRAFQPPPASREAPPRFGPRAAPSPPPGSDASPAPADTTASGLSRRVRGAQMPTTSPLTVRRAEPANGAGAPHAVASPPPVQPPTPAGSRDANDVYSFLTSFTAGVQRGLDDSRGGNGGRRGG
jgi:signal transduction histidine kinase